MTTLALVDDDENIVASLKIFFEAEGYQVRTYHDGLTALGALTDSPPDLAILAVKMLIPAFVRARESRAAQLSLRRLGAGRRRRQADRSRSPDFGPEPSLMLLGRSSRSPHRDRVLDLTSAGATAWVCEVSR